MCEVVKTGDSHTPRNENPHEKIYYLRDFIPKTEMHCILLTTNFGVQGTNIYILEKYIKST